MKRLIVMLMVLVFVGMGVAIAADTVVYEASQGKVTFNHKAHADKLKDCAKCHGKEKPAKIAITKDVAHKDLCKKCHAEMGGPTKCGDCHKK
jgi:cytochrome c553